MKSLVSDQRSISQHALPQEIAERADRFAGQNGLALPPDARWVIGLSDFAAQVARAERAWFAEGLAQEAFNRPPDAAALTAELSGVAAAADMRRSSVPCATCAIVGSSELFGAICCGSLRSRRPWAVFPIWPMP